MITVPQGWTLSYINDFAFVNPESINSKYDENFQIEYVDISSIENLKISSYELYLLKDAPSRARRIIRNNYILFSTVRPYLKAIAYVDHVGDKNNVVCSTGYAVLKEKTSKSKAKYLYYCVQNDSFLKEVMRVAEGSNYPAISDMEFKRLKLLLPSLPEQQKIAEILSGIDRSIEAMQTLIDKEKMIKKGLMTDLLNHGIDEEGCIRTPQTHRYIESPLGMIPEGWEAGNVSQFIHINPSTKVDKNKVYPFIEMDAVPFDGKRASYLSYRFGSEAGSKFKRFDTLLARITPSAENGKAMIVTDDLDIGIGSTEFIVFREMSQKTVYEFVFYLIISDLVRPRAIALMEGTSGRQRIPNNIFDDKIFVKIPSINEQQKIAQILSAQDRKIESEEANLAKLQHLKKGLMADLLSGKVRVKG